MSAKKIVTVNIKDLKTDLFVRAALNHGHVSILRDLVDGGVELPPLLVTPDFRVIDGRHRYEAYTLVGRERVEVEIREGLSEAEIIAMAYRANMGGSLPPTQADTEHTIMMLIGHGASRKKIADMLALPVSVARRYIDVVQSRLARADMQRAIEAVANDGATVQDAAKAHGVDLLKLKTALSGQKRKEKDELGEVQRQLSSRYRTLSHRNATMARDLTMQFEDGDVSAAQVFKIFDHAEQNQRRSARSFADWRKRFEAKAGVHQRHKKTRRSKQTEK